MRWLLLIFLVSFSWRFLVYFIFSWKMKWKKGNTLIEFKYLLFYSSIDLFDLKGFKRNLTDGNLIRKCVLRELDVAVFMVRGISLGKRFWVVSTWRALVWKRLKRSALNFVHTFLNRSRVFSNNESFIFYCNNSTSLESVICMKTVKSRLFKKYLKRRKSWARFCLPLGWLHISEKLQFCWCRSS